MTSNGSGHSISYKTTCPQSNDRSACAKAQADQSVLFCYLAKHPSFLYVNAGHTSNLVGNAVSRLKFQNYSISRLHLIKFLATALCSIVHIAIIQENDCNCEQDLLPNKVAHLSQHFEGHVNSRAANGLMSLLHYLPLAQQTHNLFQMNTFTIYIMIPF